MMTQLRYVRLGTSQLDAVTAFSRDILGLERVDAGENRARFRSDERAYTLEWTAEEPSGSATLGVEIVDENALDRAAEGLAGRGLESRRLEQAACVERRVAGALAFEDHSGNRIELVVRPQNMGRRTFPSRDAGILGLGHVALRSTSIDLDRSLWTDLLGARVTDRIGEACHLTYDHRHHRLSLHPASRAGVVTIGYDVENIDAIMQSDYFLQTRQVRRLFGPGRQPASGAIVVTFAAPGGQAFSYATDMRTIDREWRARQFPHAADSYCSWGSSNHMPEFAGEAL